MIRLSVFANGHSLKLGSCPPADTRRQDVLSHRTITFQRNDFHSLRKMLLDSPTGGRLEVLHPKRSG